MKHHASPCVKNIYYFLTFGHKNVTRISQPINKVSYKVYSEFEIPSKKGCYMNSEGKEHKNLIHG